MRPEGRPRFIIGTLAELRRPYNYPIQTANGFESGEALVELVGNKVVVKRGNPKSVDALRAACAVVYTSSTPIYGLEVDPALYE